MNVTTRTSKLTKTVLLCVPLLLSACGGTDSDGAGADAGESDAELMARARGIHDRVITLDTHNDINASNFTAERNYTMDLGNQVNLPNMEAGGLDVSFMIVFVGQGELNEAGYARAHAQAIEKF
ncbi:MAG TPA: hypothetical protein EYO97_09245, partial [Gemmatimonadetes bacterium]|nr:hypothetical protein [Gemmatimonadota bacterium]